MSIEGIAPEEGLDALFRRIIFDDGPERENAIRAFKRKVNNRGIDIGRIVYVENDFTHPLQYTLANRDRTIAQLKNELLGYQSDRTSRGLRMTPNQKGKAFPWDEHPDIELRASKMFLQAVPEQDIEDFVYRSTDEEVRTGRIINARMMNGRPPMSLGITVNKSGPTSWGELWKIGSVHNGKSWTKRVIRWIGASDKYLDKSGRLLSGFMSTDPNPYIDFEKLNACRRDYYAGKLPTASDDIIYTLLAAKESGLTREELAAGGQEGRRFKELLEKGMVFEASHGRLVHVDYADHYPSNEAAKAAKLHRKVRGGN